MDLLTSNLLLPIIGVLIISIIILSIYILKFKNILNIEKQKNEQLNIELLETKTELKTIQDNLHNLEIIHSKTSTELNSTKEQLDIQSKKIDFLEHELKTKEEIIKKLEIEKSALVENLENISHIEEKYEQLQKENITDKETIKELQTKLEEQKKAMEEKLKLLEENKEHLKIEFKNLASDILEDTTKKSKTSFNEILTPLQSQIKEFKEKIETLNKNETEKMGALFNELKNLKDLNTKLSNEAQNLTKALKGEVKTQGTWGEMVLYKVLELSGLREGIEYKKEVVLQGDEQTYRPDVIVYLPDEREIIIDSKNSLNAYQKYIETNDEEYLKQHTLAIKNHIKTLADKKYEHLKGINSLDFVFMFVPIENALMLALQYDTNLFEFAFKNRVLLVSPTTLLAALRAIESSWRYERQVKNIQEVIKSAESLYDKVRGFVDDFEKVGKSIETTQKHFENAKNKLTSGRGNVIRQIELLKEKANIKPKKEITI